jgi:DNA-binding CsgD family transcriptional regulator
MNDRRGDRTKTRSTREAPGFLLLDSLGSPMYANDEAVNILTYPDSQRSAQVHGKALVGKIRAVFPKLRDTSESTFFTVIKSGRRRYTCRSFSVSSTSRQGLRPTTALLLERNSPSQHLVLMGDEFHLTQREREAVEFLAQGLTSKEIADRMGISSNTVKAFLRLVMIKTGATTRKAASATVLNECTAD